MICRVCLAASQNLLQIFDVHGIKIGIADILRRHFWFQPQPNDPISTAICHGCWTKIDDFHTFYLMVEQIQLNLVKTPLPNDDITRFESECNLKENELQLCEVNIKEEFQDNLCAEDDQITEKVPEIKSIHEADLLITSQQESNKLINAEHEGATDAEKALNENARVLRKRKIVRTKISATSSQYTSDDEVHEPKSKSFKPSKRVAQQDDDIIKKHIPTMGCDLCTYVADNFTEMSKHFRIQHKKMKPYIVCCNKKLNERLRVVEHAYKHDNPEHFKCRECGKVFSGRCTLRFHMMTTHAPEEQLPFPCDRCSRKFPRKYLLDLHKPSHIPVGERTFVCDQCPNNKAFASNYLLKLHVSMRHRRATNVCHVCAKEIRDKNAFEKHVRLHFEDSGPRLKCPRPDCNSWLKDEENLRQHMLRQHMRQHNEQGKIFTCTECGNSYKNRKALSSHVHYVHPKQVFTCEECNKSFKQAILLKEHMTQHTGERLYNCQFCTQTFNSKANMYSHKKKRHPVEWDIWRKTHSCARATRRKTD